MNQVLVAIGSNLGNRAHWINKSLHLMQLMSGQLQAVSRFHETAPVGAADQNFLNGACILQTMHNPAQLMRSLLRIESLLERRRDVHWGNRTIDLDIILWQDGEGQAVEVCTPQLKIPHPEARNRDFVLIPAAEIAGDWCFPNTSMPLSQLASNINLHNNLVDQQGLSASLVQ